jgi:hypothetical protein
MGRQRRLTLLLQRPFPPRCRRQSLHRLLQLPLLESLLFLLCQCLVLFRAFPPRGWTMSGRLTHRLWAQDDSHQKLGQCTRHLQVERRAAPRGRARPAVTPLLQRRL